VLVELLRLRDQKKIFDEIFFWQTEKASVDFLLRSAKKPIAAVQVCLDISNPITRDREIRALLLIANELKLKNLILISESNESEIKVEDQKINVCSLSRWLLDAGSIFK
jgi:predicted AAA+ superfamily ATPase